jgi:hypothetical protein
MSTTAIEPVYSACFVTPPGGIGLKERPLRPRTVGIVRVLLRRRQLRRTRQLARLLVTLDDVGRERRGLATTGRRSARLSVSAR